LVRLESLELGFQYPLSSAHRANRHPPPLTRVVFPNLTYLYLHGEIEYFEDILSQIETPVLNESCFHFFNQLVFNTPLLGHFICRTETFTTSHAARVECFNSIIWISLSEREEMAGDNRRRWLGISCESLDWQLSALAQVLNSFLSSLPTLESLHIVMNGDDWQGEIEVIQWRELLHPFTAVKKVTLQFEHSVRLIAPALQELSGERPTEVLPALQNLFFCTDDWRPSGPVKEAIEQFIAARQISGHPVTVNYSDTET
jgi:hypothetical protein